MRISNEEKAVRCSKSSKIGMKNTIPTQKTEFTDFAGNESNETVVKKMKFALMICRNGKKKNG